MSNPIILATDHKEFATRVSSALGETNGRMRWWSDELRDGLDLDAVVAEITAGNPSVVALGPGLDAERLVSVATVIDELRPEISVVLIAPPTTEFLEAALRAGVRDVVSPDAGQGELQKAFWRASASAERRRATLTAAVSNNVIKTSYGKVVTIVAPKGGSGKTALTVNTAIALAEASGGRVAVVDLDLLFGDITNAMLLDPEHSIGDALKVTRLDATTLKVLLTRRSDKLYILTAPESPSQGELVTDAIVKKVIEGLRQEFDFVIVDTAAGLAEVTMAAIEPSDELILICDMSVSAVRGLRKVMVALSKLDLFSRKAHFVLNRADSKVGLKLSEVESAVGMTVDVQIPSSRLVPRSMNEGLPVTESSPKSPVARSFVEVAEMIAGRSFDDPSAGLRGRRRRE